MSFVVKSAICKGVAIEAKKNNMGKDDENSYYAKNFTPNPSEVSNGPGIDFHGNRNNDVIEGQNHESKSYLLSEEFGAFLKFFCCWSLCQ